MKIDKAIEILEAELAYYGVGSHERDYEDAIKLGIEALKCVVKIRHHPFPDEVLQLPGETPEGI